MSVEWKMKKGRRRAIVILTAAVVGVLGYNFVGEKGLVRLGQMVNRRNDLRIRVEELKRNNSRMADEIELLRSDADTVEDLARTRLGMVKPGETVYLFPEETGDLKK
jgi:cell division protein FtsB